MDKIEEEVHESVRLVAPPSFESWINGFLAQVQLEKGLSANTITSYETDLTPVCLFYMTARFLIGRMPSLMIILPDLFPTDCQLCGRQPGKKTVCSSHDDPLFCGRR